MVPKITKRGTSFKGALAYYLHDKREVGEDYRNTDDRVEWTQTRGFHQDNIDPELAGNIMAATAMDQDRLKREAGVRATGQKSKGAVYAYSIAWHPDEAQTITKAEMLRAADMSLAAIGASGRQAILVCHNDEPQPHVHVILNLVSPVDGRNLSVHADRNKLSKFALAYRQERGEEHIYCPKRAERADQAEKRQPIKEQYKKEHEAKGVDFSEPENKKKLKQDFGFDFVGGEKSRKRSTAEAFDQARAANDNRTDAEQRYQATLDKELASKTQSMKKRHKREWKDLSDRYRHKKEQIYTHAKDAISRTKKQIRDDFTPDFQTLYRRHYNMREDHKERDVHFVGMLRNVFDALKYKKVSALEDDDKGLLASAFTFVWSSTARYDALDKALKAEERDLRRIERNETDLAVNAIRSDRSELLSSARSTFDAERAALIAKQNDEQKAMRGKWRDRSKERIRAFGTITKAAEAKKQAKKEQRPKSAMKHEKMRGEQRMAAKDRKRGGRGRSRSRTRSRKGDS